MLTATLERRPAGPPSAVLRYPEPAAPSGGRSAATKLDPRPPVGGPMVPAHGAADYEPLHAALRSPPSRFARVGPGVDDQVPVHDDSRAHAATAALGAHGLTWQGQVFLGEELGRPGAPRREQVERHELVHARQQRSPGVPAAPVRSLERDAESGRTGAAADPARPLGAWWWIPPLLAGLYTFLRSKPANAPGPGDPTYASPSDLQIAGEAFALFGLPPMVGTALRGAGYSAVAVWGGSGAAGSVSYRAVGDISRGEFSGVDA